MKLDVKWTYGVMVLLIASVVGMEVSNRKKISNLRSQIEGLQKILDKSVIGDKPMGAVTMLSFHEQKLCNKGAVPRVLIVDPENNFKYFDNYEIATKMDNQKKPDYVGKVNVENRKLRFYVRDKDKFELRYYGYIYDWDDAGLVKGIETREENFHSDNCSEDER